MQCYGGVTQTNAIEKADKGRREGGKPPQRAFVAAVGAYQTRVLSSGVKNAVQPDGADGYDHVIWIQECMHPKHQDSKFSSLSRPKYLTYFMISRVKEIPHESAPVEVSCHTT
jgi:hypothetical protein